MAIGIVPGTDFGIASAGGLFGQAYAATVGRVNTVAPDAKYGKKAYPILSPSKIYEIKPEHWDRSLPYFFDVVRASPDDGTVTVSKRNGNFETGFDRFILPLNPSSIKITNENAAELTATAGAVVEENNGTIFRSITISGTTGVTPGTTRMSDLDRQSPMTAAQALGKSVLTTLAPSTTAALSNLSNIWSEPQLVTGVDVNQKWLFGHAQLHQLANWLVSYTETIKNPEARLYRLVFVSMKDNVAYVCSPTNFTCTKNTSNPHQWNYSINLRCYQLGRLVDFTVPKIIPVTVEPNAFTSALNTITNVLDTISAVGDTIDAVTADFERLGSIAIDMLGMVKGVLGTVNKIAEFPNMIKAKASQIKDRLGDEVDQIQELASSIVEGDPSTASVRRANLNASIIDLGLRSTSVTTGNALAGASLKTALRHYTILSRIALSDLSFSPAERAQIQAEQSRRSRFSRTTLNDMRNQVARIRDKFSDAKGFSDPTYDRIYRRTQVQSNQIEPNNTDFMIVRAMNDLIATIDQINSSSKNQVDQRRLPDPFTRIKSLSGQNGNAIQISIPAGATPVPFPFGYTLRDLAQRYLNDPDRWLEIALLNKLEPPYVDQEGSTVYWLSGGQGNRILLPDEQPLFIGQEVFLQSNSQPIERRTIEQVERIDPTTILIRVDGLADLERFTVAEGSRIKVYRPNTVNSSKTIFIPTDTTPPQTPNVINNRQAEITRQMDLLERSMGVDIMLDDRFQAVLGPDGDFVLVSGYQNALQALRLKLSVPRGALLRHPEYGIGLVPGISTAELPLNIRSAIEEAVLSDSRFDSVKRIDAVLQNSALYLNMEVRPKEGSGAIPLSFLI